MLQSGKCFITTWMSGSKNFIQKIFTDDQWYILFKEGVTDPLNVDLSSFHKIKPTKEKFWADPFFVKTNDKYFIFVEELPYSTLKGHISCLTVNSNGELLSCETVLSEDFHLSFPQVFQYKNRWYMLPETLENQSITLYTATDFPSRWEKYCDLKVNINAVDSSVILRDQTWWLFSYIENNDTASYELNLFSNERLVSEGWTSHPSNPIASHSNSRPAGGIFKVGEDFFRPSQISKPRYGYGMKIMKILNWDFENYEEEVISTILPDWIDDVVATHTFNFENGACVADCAKTIYRSPSNIYKKIISKL